MKSLSTLTHVNLCCWNSAIGAIVATKIMSLVGRKLRFYLCINWYKSSIYFQFWQLIQYLIRKLYIFCFSMLFYRWIGMAFHSSISFCCSAESCRKRIMAPKAVSITIVWRYQVSAFIRAEHWPTYSKGFS